jgi:hypothetical protein
MNRWDDEVWENCLAATRRGIDQKIKQERPRNWTKRQGMKMKKTNKNKKMVTIMIKSWIFLNRRP